jgi:hypothetical protein
LRFNVCAKGIHIDQIRQSQNQKHQQARRCNQGNKSRATPLHLSTSRLAARQFLDFTMLRRDGNHALNQNQIQESSELETYLPQVSGALKPEAFLKSQRSGVTRVNAPDHDVLPQSCGARYQFDGIAISGPGAKIPERRESHQRVTVAGLSE